MRFTILAALVALPAVIAATTSSSSAQSYSSSTTNDICAQQCTSTDTTCLDSCYAALERSQSYVEGMTDLKKRVRVKGPGKGPFGRDAVLVSKREPLGRGRLGKEKVPMGKREPGRGRLGKEKVPI
ncbi:hypothetical protein K402DRAFT_398166, partial [Aulographum hederae CBS 113979]